LKETSTRLAAALSGRNRLEWDLGSGRMSRVFVAEDTTRGFPWRALLVWSLLALLAASASPLSGQSTGEIRGRVTRMIDQLPINGATVELLGRGRTVVTTPSGQFRLADVPAGRETVAFRFPGYAPREISVIVTAGRTTTADAALEMRPVALGDIVVTTASRRPERVVEASAAIAVVDSSVAHDVSLTGQAPLALATLPGVQVVQNGVFDFNVNTRGFNSGFARRVIFLQDGRDQALSFLGTPVWFALNQPLEGRLEMVRGPGSALYGPNAYLGVVNYVTPPVRDVLGSSATVAGGGLNTYRADLSYATLSGDGRIGLRVSGGLYRSDSWSRSRTSRDGGDLGREYAGAGADSVPMLIDSLALRGQKKDPLTGTATGTPDPVTFARGSARLDWYRRDGSLLTAEAGTEYIDNEVFMGGTSRWQVRGLNRPWARVNWSAGSLNLMAWSSGESSTGPTMSLPTGYGADNASAIMHVEGQYHHAVFGERGQVVTGASLRTLHINTRGTVLGANDDRRDWIYSGYAEFEYQLDKRLRLVGAIRFDAGDLFTSQLSPKLALVESPDAHHAFRASINRAFLSPDAGTLFSDLPAAPPTDLSALEAGLRASQLGSALAAVPNGELFTQSAAVPILLRGNPHAKVESITEFELGYKGQFGQRAFVTLDAYFNRGSDFITSLSPGVNPEYAPWTAPAEVPVAYRAAVEQAVRDQLLAAGQTVASAGLTRIEGGRSAIVLSYANGGRVNTYGVDGGIELNLGRGMRLMGNYSLFQLHVDSTSLVTGSDLTPNTPENQGNLFLAYVGRHGLEARFGARITSSFAWGGGVLTGRIPASQTFDAGLGYRLGERLSAHLTTTNLFNQRRFQIYGGSVIGRRILLGATYRG
jgi:iron complex outermembrane receptor protein